jgi:hypothetical protein
MQRVEDVTEAILPDIAEEIPQSSGEASQPLVNKTDSGE